MFKWLVAVTALIAGGADSMLGLPELDAAVARHRAQKVDMFSKPTPDAPIAGRSFKIKLQVARTHTGGDLASDGVSGLWEYDPARQVLILDARELMSSDLRAALSPQIPHGFDGFYARYGVVPGKSYVGENGFGARAVIRRYTVTSLVLAYPRADYRDNDGMPPFRDELGFHFHKEVPLEGDKARIITAQLQLVAEGKIINFAGGTNVECGALEGEASMTSGMEVASRYCAVAAKFDRVSFQDGAGNVLAEWTR